MEISFVLVEPATPENIGAAARAIKTMGIKNLSLVNPCDHLSNPARWLAHGSNEILENAKVYNSLEEAIKDVDFIIGTSAKKRSVKNDYYPLNQLPQLITDKGQTISRVAIVFGREESGLKNEELKQCDLVTTVPLKTTYPSLNLAQAVMLYAYEISKIEYPEHKHTGKNQEGFKALQRKVILLLNDAGFIKDSNIYPRFLERLNFLGEDDINLLHSFCNKFQKNKK